MHKPSEISQYYWQGDPVINRVSSQTDKEKYNFVDLCCGAGGLSIGLEMTHKFQSVLGVDIFTEAMRTYQHNHPNTSTILGDIRKISKNMYKKVLRDTTIDLVTAGVPCQGFSLSNIKRNIEDERNFLFLEVVKFVKWFNPKVVLIENVSGMQSLGNGQFVDAISEALENSTEIGYTVTQKLLNAADYGVPQIRKRLIFIAVRKDLNKQFEFPLPEFGTENKPYNTIKDAIGDLPFLNNKEEKDVYENSPFSKYQEFLRGNQSLLLNHKAPNHPQSTVDKIGTTVPGTPMYPKYKQRIRLTWDIQSPTQLAGGIRPQFQFGHPEQPRGLSIRERARIQSFPDNFEFLGGLVQGRVQTGNAVPPLLARAVGKEILKILE